MWLPSAPAEPPVNAESVDPEIEVVVPIIPHSSPGAATHLTIPPKVFTDRFNLAAVVEVDLKGPVEAAI